MPEGGEEWRQSGADSCWQVGARAWHKVIPELSRHTFPSAHAWQLAQDRNCHADHWRCKDSGRLRGRKALAFGMSMTLGIHLAQCLTYEKPSINGGAALRLSWEHVLKGAVVSKCDFIRGEGLVEKGSFESRGQLCWELGLGDQVQGVLAHS